MPAAINPLSKAQFEKAITGLDQKLAVGNGLYYHARGGSSLWVLQYREGQSFRARSLGSYPELSLYAARQAREAFAVARRTGRIERRGLAVIATAAPASEPVTVKRQRFADVLDGYLAVNAPGWKDTNRDNHVEKYRCLLATPLASLWINEITTADIETAFKPMTPGVAESHRMRVKLILDYAAAKGLRDKLIPNPAAKDILKHLIASAPKSKPHAAMPSEKVPALIAALVADGSPAARALAFLILTAARTGEVRGARWEEIKGNVWTVPASRMKELVEHSVPLSPAALALLGEPKASGPIFPGLAERAINTKLKATGGNGFTVHGFRACFSGDWAAKAGYSLELRDRALAHKVGGDVTSRYNRDTLLDQRRELMSAWSKFCTATEGRRND
jgi:integrase